MPTSRNSQPFATVRAEGLLLPPELIARVADLDPKLPGIRPEDYNLPKGERVNEATNRAWNRLTTLWSRFRKELESHQEGGAATGPTRDRWLLPLFEELGYGRLQRHAAFEIDGKSYAISHLWGHTPIHLVGAGLNLDKRAPGQAGAAQASPHGLVQQFLNRTDDHRWAFLSNGLKLRILRDNVSLTRQAYVEFDLAAMMDGELYSDFRLLWLLCHQSRVESERPEQCWLERWTQDAREQGARALEHLREGVENAIRALGSGFLAHPANLDLHAHLESGELEAQDYYRQLLRLVYRLVFLFVAEDRDLLHINDDTTARQRYLDYYSAARLRRIAHRLKGSRHEDLFEGLKVVMAKLHADGYPALALPALGSFLWDPAKLPDLSGARIRNRDLLEAIRALAFVQQERSLRPVDYRNLGTEELGSVYESLLELHPKLHRDAATFDLKTVIGSERKTSGSYYTPDSLVQCLLDAALDPVVDEAIKGKTGAETEQAILALKVCDPAVGSGHFLVGAAHRLARHLARVRALADGDSEPSPLLYQHALRDVIGRCLYGVDIKPMAAELCRVSLWLEALEPGKPLSFLDHHIRVGNSLIGATPELVAAGIPDDAFKPLEGDDQTFCREYKKQNKRERQSRIDDLFGQDGAPWEHLGNLAAAMTALDDLDDGTVEGVREKRTRYENLVQDSGYLYGHLLADAWCAAFVWPKRETPEHTFPITTDMVRKIEENPFHCPPWMRTEIERLTRQYGFFHWHLEFPSVFGSQGAGGFDCVLGNPPWERVKIQEKEWFAERSPEIATARNAAARKQMIAALETEDPGLYRQFLDDLRRANGEAQFLRHGGRYPLCGQGDINVYSVFAEHILGLLGPCGRAGFIVPSGIATDDTTKDYFASLASLGRLASLYHFENENKVFPGVHHAFRFVLLALGPAAGNTSADLAFFLRGVDGLRDAHRHFALTPADFQLLNPNTRTCPIVRSRADAELNKHI